MGERCRVGHAEAEEDKSHCGGKVHDGGFGANQQYVEFSLSNNGHESRCMYVQRRNEVWTVRGRRRERWRGGKNGRKRGWRMHLKSEET